MEKRLKPSTVENKKWIVGLKIMPFLEKEALNGIKPTDVRKWQNNLKSHRDDKGVPYSVDLLIGSKYFEYKLVSRTIFMTLYYTGMREGELLALTPADIDLEKKEIRINKSYQRLNKKDVITPPKTPKSNRTITTPDKLCTCSREYIDGCY